MEDKELPVPFKAHEADMARLERSNRRLTIALCVVIATVAVGFVLNNAIWLYYENYRQEMSYGTTQEATP